MANYYLPSTPEFESWRLQRLDLYSIIVPVESNLDQRKIVNFGKENLFLLSHGFHTCIGVTQKSDDAAPTKSLK